MDFLRNQALLGVLIVLIAFFTWRSPFFLTFDNLLGVGSIVSILGIMAITQTFLVISGGIDISIGAAAAFTGVVLGRLYQAGYNVWLAALAALVVGLLIGLLNGTISVKLGVDPLVVTLGTYSIFTGGAFIVANTTTLIISDDAFSFIGAGKVGPIPFSLILFLLVFAVGLVVERLTVFGRSIYAIGGNLEAARLSGVRVDRTRIILFALSGLSAGLAGVLLTAQLSASSANVGSAYLLSVVTAVILGGASLKGGRGTLVGTLIAVAILGLLQNGFALLEVSSFAQTMVLGALLIAAVILDQSVRRSSR
jgi:ribose transport system permease protein